MKRQGRPKKAKANQHLVAIKVRLTKAQYKTIKDRATTEEVVLARYIRRLLTGEL